MKRTNNEYILELPLYGVVILLLIIAYLFTWTFITISLVLLVSWKAYCWILYLNETKFASNPLTKQFKVIIFGGGFGGIHAAIECKKNGIPFVLFEKNDKVGGTWAYNEYPGCACDVAAHLYTYSFESYDWKCKYPERSDIQKYVEHCAKKYEVIEHVKFNTLVNSIKWDKNMNVWKIVTSQGTHTGNVIINACGALHVPNIPKFSGAESFRGNTVHSSQMNSSMNFSNKSVAVIGSAASAIQLIPPVAKQAKQLYVFQRTPNWVLDKFDYVYSPFVRFLFKYVPGTQWIHRLWLYWRNELIFLAVFGKNSKTSKKLSQEFTSQLNKLFPKENVNALVPNYPIGCKRILISDKLEYYHALFQPNVCLITSPIEKINETGIVVNKKHIQVDDIIYATGFKVGSVSFSVEGSRGPLSDEQQLEAYWGITFNGLPNYFHILGPNTALGHNSVVWMSECQIHYITHCIKTMISNSIKCMEVKKEKVDSWYKEIVLPGLETKVWTASCSSWYKDDKNRVFALWPYSTYSYWWGLLNEYNNILKDYNITY